MLFSTSLDFYEDDEGIAACIVLVAPSFQPFINKLYKQN